MNRTRIAMIFTAGMLSLSACGKREEFPVASGSFTPVPSSWSVGSETFHPDRVVRSGNNLFAVDSIGLLGFTFANLPTADGVYTIGDPKSGPNNVYIEARTGEDFGSFSGSLTVTVAAGKIRIIATDVQMLRVPMFTDTLKLSAHLTEQ